MGGGPRRPVAALPFRHGVDGGGGSGEVAAMPEMMAELEGLAEQAGNLVAGERIDVAFMPKMSTWKGRRQIELHVKDFRAPAKSKDP